MANTRDIRQRIRSVKNTQQITKAMKMVAAARLRRAQERTEQARPYAAKLEEVIGSIASGSGSTNHPMLVSRPVKKTGYVVISSDRGLAGSFNAQVIRTAVNEMRGKSQNEYAVFAIGRKARDFFKRRGYPLVGEVTGLSDNPTYADIKSVASQVVQLFQDGVYDEVYVMYNEFVNALTQVPVSRKLLPLEDVGGQQEKPAPGTITAKYDYEPSAEAVLDNLLPKYAETLIFSAVLESKASEFGARMTAMGAATDNAATIINGLTLALNRARQAAITTQITEIVGGAAALES
ncbi:F-type H+-transporting ATPase subunit gamma [Tumebacillus sp. BK434]|uniref:ATP synthase F1 subunit gamma n=1 Tax=Tumebacillus sp. BK434 TaxID=2512169 RepID=UPI0010494878|nr:ATP synthase F1 subunit gamma [Tumebacillus sp. BK434]TCP57739.1 F-type H+-transporting ATPase subunit gamma [Tumebacillus sp. BK434]